VLHELEEPVVVKASEEVLQIRLEYPPNLSASDHLVEGRQSVMGTAAVPPAK
jgi:hypothetical protein